jgi:hypothetical protein
MTIDWSLVATIAAPLLALVVGAVLNHFAEARPRLVTYLAHASAFRAQRPEGPVQVNTHSVVLRNVGRKPATNVRLGHNLLPDFQVYPDVQYRVEALPNGGTEIVFPMVVPQKQITISYLYFPPVTWEQINTHFESDEGPGKVITVLPQPQYPRWLINCLRALVYVGGVTVLYLLFLTARWVSRYAA